MHPPPPCGSPPCVTFRRVVASLRGPGGSPVVPFACCVGSLRSVGRCGRCSCRCRFRVRGAQLMVCRGCAGCGGMCCLHVSSAQWLASLGLCWLLRGSFDCFRCPHTSVLRPSLRFCVREARVRGSSARCPGRPPRTLPRSAGRVCAGRVPCWLRVACASWLTRVACAPAR